MTRAPLRRQFAVNRIIVKCESTILGEIICSRKISRMLHVPLAGTQEVGPGGRSGAEEALSRRRTAAAEEIILSPQSQP